LIRAIRILGKVQPIFVETPNDMPKEILSYAQAGDVVIVMGAGNIGQVASKTRELAQ
jgi:UDP-N-acetylmuramate--alanine ligase